MSAPNYTAGPLVATARLSIDVDRINPVYCGSSNIDRSFTKPRSESVTWDRNHVTENEEGKADRYNIDDAQEPASEKPVPSQDNKNHNQVTWDGPDDPDNPRNWSTPYKLFLTTLGCITAFDVTFASSAPTPALTFIAKEFNISVEVANLITTLFLVGYITGPVLWGPGSELLGRRFVFRASIISYTLFILGQTLAHNVETLFITRFIAGVFAAAPMTNCGALMADIWAPAARGHAVSFFVVCVFIGPVVGPVVGSFVPESHLGWRWIFWIMMIISAVCAILIIFCMPEIYAPVLLQWKARRFRKADPVNNAALYAEHDKENWSFYGIINRTLYRPFYMLYKEPILVLVTLYLSFIYGILYALFEAVPLVFIGKRGWRLGPDGLAFLAVGLGSCLAAALNFCFSARYASLIEKWKGFPPPEERLLGAMVAGPCLVIGALLFGWTGHYPSVHWVAPAFGMVLVGISVGLIFVSLVAYMVDVYLMYSASAMAANTMCRSAIAAAFPLFTVQMFTNLGINWASTLVACIGIVLLPSPLLFYKYGSRIRTGSTFAPCIDKRARGRRADSRLTSDWLGA